MIFNGESVHMPPLIDNAISTKISCNGVVRTLKMLRTSKGDYCIKH